MTNLEELEKLLSAATQGPWEFRATEHSGGIKFVVAPNEPRNDNGTEYIPADCSHGYNGRLIATLRNAAPALLEVVRVAKAIYDYDSTIHDGFPPWGELEVALQKLEEVEI